MFLGSQNRTFPGRLRGTGSGEPEPEPPQRGPGRGFWEPETEPSRGPWGNSPREPEPTPLWEVQCWVPENPNFEPELSAPTCQQPAHVEVLESQCETPESGMLRGTRTVGSEEPKPNTSPREVQCWVPAEPVPDPEVRRPPQANSVLIRGGDLEELVRGALIREVPGGEPEPEAPQDVQFLVLGSAEPQPQLTTRLQGVGACGDSIGEPLRGAVIWDVVGNLSWGFRTRSSRLCSGELVLGSQFHNRSPVWHLLADTSCLPTLQTHS